MRSLDELIANDDDFDLDRAFPAATVTITRTSESDFKSRQLIVSIDGERVGTLLWAIRSHVSWNLALTGFAFTIRLCGKRSSSRWVRANRRSSKR